MEKRNCPVCDKELIYKRRCNYLSAVKKNQICLQCENNRRKTAYAGEKNPFYGKTHTQETIDKIKSCPQCHAHTKEDWFRKLRSEQCKGEKNPIWGTSDYEIWITKFGKEKADHLEQQRKDKLSKAMSGSTNPMYGKPSPQGAGNGWSGWYKGWFFRSLRELSYMVNVIEAQQLSWRTGETADLKIKYKDWEDNDRTYTADFLVEERLLIEVKPEKLKSSKTVRTKQDAAVLFCKERGWEYHLIDPPVLAEDEVKNLYLTKQIKFTKRYESLFLERILNEDGITLRPHSQR